MHENCVEGMGGKVETNWQSSKFDLLPQNKIQTKSMKNLEATANMFSPRSIKTGVPTNANICRERPDPIPSDHLEWIAQFRGWSMNGQRKEERQRDRVRIMKTQMVESLPRYRHEILGEIPFETKQKYLVLLRSLQTMQTLLVEEKTTERVHQQMKSGTNTQKTTNNTALIYWLNLSSQSNHW